MRLCHCVTMLLPFPVSLNCGQSKLFLEIYMEMHFKNHWFLCSKINLLHIKKRERMPRKIVPRNLGDEIYDLIFQFGKWKGAGDGFFHI